MLKRREFLMAPFAAAALLASPTGAVPATRRFDATARLQSLEVGQARLGVCFLDTVTAKFRDMGDTATRLDRYEPDLGLVLSADLRDTTSPLAMAHLVRRITTGDLLQNNSRERLLQWMQDTRTSPNRLRAGLPAEWRSGNKTGTGRTEGTTNRCNDVAITFPPGRPPVIIAGYFDSGEYIAQAERRHEAVLAAVGRIAAQWAIGELRRSPDRAQQFSPSPVRVSRISLHSRAMCASNWPRRTR